MKVNDSNLSSLASTAASQTQGTKTEATGRTGQAAQPSDASATSGTGAGDDIHLSELVRSLRSLAADSPERQARIEQLARAYADGSYNVDASATASKMVDDALQSP